MWAVVGWGLGFRVSWGGDWGLGHRGVGFGVQGIVGLGLMFRVCGWGFAV